MNFNAVIAVFVLKGIITEDEGDRLVEHLNDKPQSTVLRDAIAAVAEVIGKPAAVVQPPLGPVGPAQQAEELAARNAVASPQLPEPELAKDEAKVDADQSTSDTVSEGKTETDEDTKGTSVKKSKEEPKKK